MAILECRLGSCNGCNMTLICTPPSQLVHTTSRRFAQAGSGSAQLRLKALPEVVYLNFNRGAQKGANFKGLSRNWNIYGVAIGPQTASMQRQILSHKFTHQACLKVL